MTTGLGGSSDSNSGGGAGSGIPDAETQMRTGGRAGQGDVKADRAKLFPDYARKRARSETAKRKG